MRLGLDAMRYKIFIGLIIGAIALISFTRYTPVKFQGTATIEGQEPGEKVLLTYREKDDIFGGGNAKWLKITLELISKPALQKCTLQINEYSSLLGKLEVYSGFVSGNHPRGESDLLPNEPAHIEFLHDNNNHLAMRSTEGEQMPSTESIKYLKISCRNGKAIWNL